MWMITWREPERQTKDWEEYDTREDADAALAEFVVEYPWNTYRLCWVTKTIAAKEKWKSPYAFRITTSAAEMHAEIATTK